MNIISQGGSQAQISRLQKIMEYTENLDLSHEFITGGFTIINSDHTLIHKGYGLTTNAYFTLTNGASIQFSWKAPLLQYVHYKNLVMSVLGGGCKVEIIKDATVTEGATPQPITNLNHNSTYVTGSSINLGSSYTGGTIWDAFYIQGDATRQNVPSTSTIANPNEELVLQNNNELYVWKFTNLGTDTIQVFARAFFYEEMEGIY